MFKVGDVFESFEEFQLKLLDYEKATFNYYWIRDCKTLKIQASRFPKGIAALANTDLKYYYVRIACIKGGRRYEAKNVKRKSLTYKQGCPAGMYLKVSSCGKYLQIDELNEEHNHTVSKILFNSLPNKRLNLSAETEELASHVRKNKIRVTLKDLLNLNKKPEYREGFLDCIDILKLAYDCYVDVLYDIDENLLCLFFQNVQMKNMFAVYPEIIFVDATYCPPYKKIAIYLIMAEDSEGYWAVVAVGILLNENKETIDWFINQFKNCNPNTDNIRVIFSEKDSKGGDSLKILFPGAVFQISLFHTLQNFYRQVSEKNMNISNEECETARRFLKKLAYSKSEKVYETVYKEMKASVPKIVIDYYVKNWHSIRDQWVLYLTFNNKSFLNKTNDNKLGNLIKKMKSVILKYSNLEELIQNFFHYINSTRVKQNISDSFKFHNKVSTNLYPKNSSELTYKTYLTNYAYEKVQQQLNSMKDCSIVKVVHKNKYMAPTSQGFAEVTDKTCKCTFSSTMGLPCSHIFMYRSAMNLPLFDKDICLNRWTRSYFEEEHPYFNKEKYNSESNVNGIKNSVDKKKELTKHKKFKLMNDECCKLSKLCTEVTSDVFYKRLGIIQYLVNKWSNDDKSDKDETLINCESVQQSECMDICDSD